MKHGPLRFPLHIPFVEELGFELWAFAGGQAQLRVDLAQAHLNSWEVAHGGVLMTLLDVAMAHAARSVNAAQEDHGPGVATIEMKTSFMRAAEGRLTANAKLLHRTTTLAFCEGSVLDDDGALCAHATATFKYLRALPSKRRELKPLQPNIEGTP
ncbi:MAG: PaaI family thioesterase [Burkholderiales bacterium]|nr:PaaI family thioesterase [Burkholderiales bacterium]MDE1927408.1 PaaI family thioesterase [Burkholderiales bacterium]MDE2158102.1 PaaI family thioesterase [Burkholderiales bacterium]MDE2503340.1 PaaI family thioesterase [Burkholderiales bacterium]